MKILLIRLSSAGDILLLNDAIKILKKEKKIKIFLLTKEKYKELADILQVESILIRNSNNFFKNILNFFNIIKTINKMNFDFIFDFQNNLKTKILTKFLNAKIYYLNKSIIKRRLMVLFKWFLNKRESVSEKYTNLIKKALNLKEFLVKKIKKKKKIKKILIHIGAKWKLKRWPYFYDLINNLKNKKFKIIITGLKEEIEKEDKLLYIKNKNIENKIGKINLKDLYKIVKSVDCFIGNDTMIVHMAAINDIPGIVIMGPTHKAFGFIDERKFIILEKDLNCRPCHLHGGNNCPIQTFDCMKKITPEEVWKKLKNLKK